MNLITDCPQEVQSLAAANLANMAKSSLGRNILKRHGGLQKLVRLHIKLKVAETVEGLIFDSLYPESRLSIDMFGVMLLRQRGLSQRLLPPRCTNLQMGITKRLPKPNSVHSKVGLTNLLSIQG